MNSWPRMTQTTFMAATATGRMSWVSSSCLCKKLEGAVLPILVEAAKDRIDDSIDALDIGEDHHGARAPADFHEAALDGIGGAQLLPEVPGKGIEVQELRQVLVQTLHHPGVDLLPDRKSVV